MFGVRIRQWLHAMNVGLVAVATGLSFSVHSMQNPSQSSSSSPASSPRTSANIFISGHSLVDQPMPDHLAAIARSMGTPLNWNRQYIVGSSIAARSRGTGPGATAWSGYRAGVDRAGGAIDVLAELRSPQTIDGGRYDVLLITEQHGLLGSLTWNDTVRNLRHFHERLIEGNPQATTYFYEAWLGLIDKDDPRRWIDYERAASPIWQCISTRINTSLGAEGRGDRILSLPMGLALAELIGRATTAPGLPGITLGSARATVDSLVRDDVHLTAAGSYFAALVSYAVIYRKGTLGAWHPDGVRPAMAEALQRAASEFVDRYRRTNLPLTLEQCRQTLQKSFIQDYWGYTRDAIWLKELNPAQAYLQWARQVLQWQWRVRRSNFDNPFHFDPALDASHWLTAP